MCDKDRYKEDQKYLDDMVDQFIKDMDKECKEKLKQNKEENK